MSRVAPRSTDDLAEYADGFALIESFMGFVPSSLRVMARVPGLLDGMTGLSTVVFLNDLLPVPFKQLVGFMASAGAGCRYCQAHTAAHAAHLGVDPETLVDLWSFETSERFTDPERTALRLALHSGQSPNAVTDADFAECRRYYTDDQITAIVAVCRAVRLSQPLERNDGDDAGARAPRGRDRRAHAPGLDRREARVSEPPTIVTLTGTGVPLPAPGRAGPGTLVQYGDVALQFDAGRATVLRLTEVGCPPHALTAMFVTHVHSDHVVALADVVLTRWLFHDLFPRAPLPVVVPEGSAARFVRRVLDAYDDDVALRIAHVQPGPPTVDLRTFDAPPAPKTVWTSDDGAVIVEAVAVHHEPVDGAVAFRVTTPTGVVVVSGDTRVCGEVEQLSCGADVLVHEACRTTAIRDVIAGTSFQTIFSYHADTVPLGAMAERAGVAHLVLTHLIPPPNGDAESAEFAADVRHGGYTGRVSVGTDLSTVTLGGTV